MAAMAFPGPMRPLLSALVCLLFLALCSQCMVANARADVHGATNGVNRVLAPYRAEDQAAEETEAVDNTAAVEAQAEAGGAPNAGAAAQAPSSDGGRDGGGHGDIKSLLGKFDGTLKTLPVTVVNSLYIAKCVAHSLVEDEAYKAGVTRLLALIGLGEDVLNCGAFPVNAAAKALFESAAKLPPIPLLTTLAAIEKGESQAQSHSSFGVALAEVAAGTSSALTNPQIDAKFKWPNNLIPYYLEQDQPATQRDAQAQIAFVIGAIRFTGATNVAVLPIDKKSKVHKVRVKSRPFDECSSQFGMVASTTNEQNMNVGAECGESAAQHEIMHAAGFLHTQQRLDRDLYVKVNRDNVKPDKRTQFDIRTDKKATELEKNYKYDYTSIMHYGKTAFAKDKDKKLITLEPRADDDPDGWKKQNKAAPIGTGDDIGAKLKLSDQDIKMINDLYPKNTCSASAPAASTQTEADVKDCLDVALSPVAPCVVTNKCDLQIALDVVEYELDTPPKQTKKDMSVSCQSTQLVDADGGCRGIKIEWSFDKKRLKGTFTKGTFSGQAGSTNWVRKVFFFHDKPGAGDTPERSEEPLSIKAVDDTNSHIVELAHKNDGKNNGVPDDYRKRIRVQLTAHASKVGQAAYNMELSKRRAKMVKEQLAFLVDDDQMWDYVPGSTTPSGAECQEVQKGIRACGSNFATDNDRESRVVEIIVFEV